MNENNNCIQVSFTSEYHIQITAKFDCFEIAGTMLSPEIAPQLSGGPSQPTRGPSQLSEGPSQPDGGPPQPSGGPSQPNGGPSQLSEGPSQPNGGPSQPSGGPSQPSGGPSQPDGGPPQSSGGPPQPTGGPSQLSVRPPGFALKCPSLLYLSPYISSVMAFSSFKDIEMREHPILLKTLKQMKETESNIYHMNQVYLDVYLYLWLEMNTSIVKARSELEKHVTDDNLILLQLQIRY